MTQNPSMTDVQKGWKVFAQSDEVGSVVDVAGDHILVRHGLVRQHVYRVAGADITEASDGIVDLRLDRDQFEQLEVGLDPERWTRTRLPDEYVRLDGEGRLDEPQLREPPDPPLVIR